MGANNIPTRIMGFIKGRDVDTHHLI
jgi:hypothetical protein